ncbi:TM2 domain protein [Natronococcus occultus]|uniref:TM2 domain protein n=1 Tax=Natronococcus occultus SP4 TaxID=694430 RepID=L0K0K6_9EURY|nr:TM2 domain protein [Natronococcus occultus]AGB38095.1 TM2 domain protein [Natronococcus occultus SP4]
MTGLSRPIWPAYLLTVLVAGLGHWYLGRWKRGAIWFVLYVLALGFLSARSVSGALDLGDPFVVTALQVESVSYTDIAVPLAILIVCLVDVYLIGLLRRTASPSETPPGEARSNGPS